MYIIKYDDCDPRTQIAHTHAESPLDHTSMISICEVTHCSLIQFALLCNDEKDCDDFSSHKPVKPSVTFDGMADIIAYDC